MLKPLCLFFLVFVGFSCQDQIAEPESKIEKDCLITLAEYSVKEQASYNVLYEYDENRNITKYSEVPTNSSVKPYVLTYKNEYDSNQRISKKSTFKDQKEPIEVETFSYHSDGKLKERRRDYGLKYFEIYKYNELGKEIWYSQNYEPIERTTTYNSDGQLLEMHRFKNGVEVSSIVNTYNSQNKIISAVERGSNSLLVMQYKYDLDGQLLVSADNNGKAVKYSYGPMKKEYENYSNGKLESAFREEFDSSGKLLKKFQSFNGKDFVIMLEISYHLTNHKSLEKRYIFKPNSTTEFFMNIEMKFNEKGKMLNYQNYDSKGTTLEAIKNTFKCD